MSADSRPIVAVTSGDPAGIGPEVVLSALRSPRVAQSVRPVVIGSVQLLLRCAREAHIEDIDVRAVTDPSHVRGIPGVAEVLDTPTDGIETIIPGKVQKAGGIAADAYIRRACDLARDRRIDAISTAPISKESLRAAGIREIGHTELLAEYLNSPDPLTLFVTENMRIFFLSRHLSLRQAIEFLSRERLLQMIMRVNDAMLDLGFQAPHIGVAALNPHASDGGQFGHEERDIIIPAVEDARLAGLSVEGPVPADSVFHQALEGRFDCVISLYHDQGHIAAKTRDFFRTVTATLGLPVLRTSVDHGTGFDIAWQGKANSLSMEAAILAVTSLRPDGARGK